MPASSAEGAAAAAAARNRSATHAAGGLGRQACRGEDGQQPPGADVTVGATRPRLGIGHGPALVEDGVTGRTAEFVNGHVVSSSGPAAYAKSLVLMRPCSCRNP